MVTKAMIAIDLAGPQGRSLANGLLASRSKIVYICAARRKPKGGPTRFFGT